MTVLRDLLEQDLRAFSMDALGAAEPDRLPDQCARWVESTIASFSERILRSTVLALAEELERALAEAPPGVTRRLELACAQAEAGIE